MTAQFASALIGKREIVRQTVSTSTEAHPILSDTVRGHSYGEQHQVEDAVMASEIEALPDRAGFVKFASGGAWNFVNFPYFDVKQQAEPYEVVRQRASGGWDSGNPGDGAAWREGAFPAMLATTFSGSPGLTDKDDNLERLRSFMAQLEAMRTGMVPITEGIAAVLQDNNVSIEECVELLQSTIGDVLGQRATALATAMRQALKGHGATDYVEAIKIMAAQRSL